MKKRLLAAMTFAAALSMYGCSSSSDDRAPAATEISSEAEATETAEASSEAAADTASIDGVVVDASMNTLTIQTPETGLISFDTSAVEEKDLADGLLIGHIVNVSYTGEPEEGKAIRLADSDKTSKLSADRLQFAADVLTAASSRNLEFLASLTRYPVYVGLEDGLTVHSADELTAMDPQEIFTDELVEAVTTADLLNTEEVEAGVVLGDDQGFNIIFSADDSGKLGISGINYGKN